MNIFAKKNIYNFLKKLNTLKTYRDVCKLVTEGLKEITNAHACWICLIDPITNKIGHKTFCYDKSDPEKIRIAQEIQGIYEISADLLTSNFDSEDLMDYFNAISKNEKIIEPIIYNNTIMGYLGVFGREQNFNKKYHLDIGATIENINSKLEVIYLLEEAEKAERARVEFLASISHEFKTPLNSIIGFSDVLKDKWANTGDYKYVDNISKSSKFLLSLIQDVLDLARVQSSPMELNYKYFRPKDIIVDILWGFEEARKTKKLEINYTLSDVELAADKKRFKQLIYNLVSNAIKFNRPGGKITIVTYINEHKEFVFEIKDTGDGIRKKDYAKIFNFFAQVSHNQLKRQQGSGVGLALCQMITQAHGGRIEFKSKLNYGSTFWFSVPQYGLL